MHYGIMNMVGFPAGNHNDARLTSPLLTPVVDAIRHCRIGAPFG